MEHLQLDLAAAPLRILAARNEKSRSELGRFLTKQVWTQQDRQSILTTLSQLLLDKECTVLIGRQLRPIVLDLLERNREAIQAGGQINHDLHERLCVAMSKLISSHPDVLPFALRYFKGTFPVFQRLFLESSDANPVRFGRRRMKLRDLMEAAFKFLQQNQSAFRELWDWSVCVPLLRSHDTLVRWYTANCLSLITSMNEEHKLSFLKKIFNSEELIHYRLKLLEEAQLQDVEKALVLVTPDTALWQREKEPPHTQGHIVSGDLSAHVTAVCGVLLPRQYLAPTEQEVVPQSFVLVESVSKNLQSLALAVASQSAVLLEGPIGCGKTSLVEHLAAMTGRKKSPHILKVQLGDQTDSKMLLGMYRCTDVPGEFIWQPGTLTQAVTKGHWILLEDIDYAPLDVISVLIPLLENRELLIPGRGDCLKVAPGFQFFATRRLFGCAGNWYRPHNSHAILLDKYWTRIHLENMDKTELKEVLQNKYPSLSSATDHLLDIYLKLTGDKHQSKSINYNGNEEVPMDISEARGDDKNLSLEGRELSLRDLLNWCNRISYSFDSSSSSTSLNIFQEALDCFTAMLSKQTSRLKMAEVIGSKLNISKKKAEYFCQLYKPEIVVNELEVEVGRARLLRIQNPAVQVQREKLTFAATRPASILMEQLAVCVSKGEPVLLVGETGTGKTSAVQYLAHITGHRLRVVNMNQQSDTADLLGGYKPVDHKLIWLPLREGFEELFTQTFSRKQNLTFLGHIQTCYRQKRWRDLLKLMQHVHKSALNKETKTSDAGLLLREKWEAFGLKLNHAHQQMKMTENALLFAFVEGTLAQAVKKGEWILLDEINLAAPETLECLSGLLEGCSGSLILMDRGDTEPLTRHPDFRLFACMNPATDVGKKNLPQGIRNRLTELYVEELESKEDLQILIVDYLKGLNVNKNIVQGIINFYIAVRKESMNKLVDGTGHRPHYSLRTLCRALRFAASNPCHNIQRSLYEGFCLGFLTQLDRASHPVVQKLICQHVISSNIKTLLKQPIPEPKGGRLIQIEGYWISVGDKEPTIDETYILTPSVKLNLRDIVRVVSAGTYPVLIQGETSVGKTSLIRWLAAASGNHCVRINNHEHTDIQEYIGCYTSDASGKLVFKEGVLIDAMRKGYWIILDELNLAPTDVLEALNRLLDDNRELHITETQEVVKAHPRFILFATQNPPGLYGGRKVLSRAFRNRFVELHFDELPSTELETILHKRCSLPPSYCNKLVKVMQDLQSYRRGSSLFAGKQGFITLRDLFRWAERYRSVAQTEKEYDWLQHLANDGFMLLAGRVRKQEEVNVIQEVLGKHFKKKCCPQSLFSEDSVQKLLGKFSAQLSTFKSTFSHIVWTEDMRRLAILAGRALEFGEPILLVGDTGCGKTTICQIFAALANQKLYSVNCHLHMETSDFLGGLRPVKQRSKDKEEFDHSKLFEWHDGPLVLAMKEDGFFLLDEISLADDSVLERLNSVLEVEKTLVLAEKGSPEDDKKEVELLTAGKKFRILATMNPGGDFGKKELSPALRNRFTEIWCPQNKSRNDLIQIVKRSVHPGLSLGKINCQGTDIAELMMDFIDWLTSQEFGRRCIVSIRDILSWVNFMNVTRTENTSQEGEEVISTVTSFVHAACLVYVDGIGSGTTSCGIDIAPVARKECLQFLIKKLSEVVQLTESMKNKLRIYDKTKDKEFICMDNFCGIHPFFIPKGTVSQRQDASDYALNAGTTAMNAQRLLRATKLNKPILLEGSPGVGKTSLVSAIAKASGNHLVRINLSEQTDITDLFGANLPVEGGKGGEFSWRDGPLLAALKAGHWIVLDELNLASQSVLEGLNACFDHRAEVYIPEIGMNFKVQHKKTKIFGCQNPYQQGGGRKGLPRSFLNRFTQVYVDPLSASDMEFIAKTLFPAIEKSIVAKMVAFNKRIDQEVTLEKKWGQKGGPWEFNLRDLFRWCQLILVDQSPGGYDPSQHVYLVYGERMRSREDKEKVISVFKAVFGPSNVPYMGTRQFHITPYEVQVGYSVLSRGSYIPQPSLRPLSLLHQSLKFLEPVMKCVQMNWMVILVGPTAVGKTSLVQLLAHLTGHTLKIMAMNSAMDTTELLGGFEQVDIIRPWRQLLKKVESTVSILLRDSLLLNPEDAEVVLRAWSNFFLTYKPKTLGEVGKNITVEIVNKLEAVLLLVQRLNNKINSFSKAEFSKLVEEFRSFRLKLIQTVDGRSHGTFEWVDSMLVQALQSGDWLLMDNVNFCNPSVLDRLNALLEPGGVLTVSERGVIDGSTPTIAPHPNFRLFLSMDPIHGEISRAMRNRGIEIYIPGERNEDSPDPLDLKLLLHSIGLVGDNLCDTLIAMHTETREVIAGSPTSSFSTFFHTATLIAQRLLRGLSVAKAFYGACWEAYVCAQQSPANQQLVREILLRCVSSLKSPEKQDSSLLAMGVWPDSLPSALFATEDSHLSTVRSDGQILVYCLNRLSLKTSKWERILPLTLQDLEKVIQSSNFENLKFSAIKMDTSWLDETCVLSASVKLLVERATNQDWVLRVRWLHHLAKNIPQGLESIKTYLESGATSLSNFYSNPISAEIRNVIKTIQPNVTDESVILLDPRWNMQSLDITRNSMDFDRESCKTEKILVLLESIANRTNLYLNREKRVFTETNLVSTGGKKSKNNSVLRMSIEFQKDPENYQNLPHEIVVHLAAFFEFCDSLILFWVQSSQVELPDAKLVKILHSMLWRDRFWKASDMVKVDSQGLTLLSLHWHWVSKHLVGRIPRLLIGYEEKCYKEVLSVSEHIQNCLGSPMGGFQNVKKVQKAMGRPFPFKDKLVVECFEQLNALNKALSILELKPTLGEDGRRDEIIPLRVTAVEYSLKKQLLQAWGLILRASHLEDVNLDTLKNLVNVQCLQLKTKGVSIGCPEKKGMENVIPCQPKAASLIPLANKIQLWPGMEYLAVLWQYKITTDCLARTFLRKYNNNQQRRLDHEISHHIAFCLKYTPCTSQQLKSLWYLMDHEGSNEEMTSLWSDLINSTFTSFWSSTVTTDPEYWLTWKPLHAVERNEIYQPLDPSLKGPGLFNKAVFSKCFFEVLTRNCRSSPWDISGLSALSSSHVTLGEWEERAQQLKDISTILWTNMAVSNMAELRSTDSHLQWVLLYRPLLALAELVPAPWKQEYIRQCNRLPSKDRMAFHHVCRTLGDMIGQEVLPEEMLGFMLTCVRHLFGEGESRKDIPEVAERGSLWVYLGLSQVQAWLPQTQFDPAIRREYKLKYAKEELHELECEWKTRNLLSQLHTGRDLEDEIVIQYSHPHIRTLRRRIQQLKEQISRLLRKQAFRPQMPSYESLVQDIHHYVTSIARMSSVQDLLTRLINSFRADLSKSSQAIQNLLKEEASWQQSQHKFRKQLMEEYALFPDAVAPLQAAILQMQHGMRLVASEVYAAVHSGLVCRDKLNSLVTSLLSFPSVGSTFPTYFSHADALCSVKIIEVLRGLKKVSLKHSAGHELEGKDQKPCPTQEQLLMNALLYLRSHVFCKGEMDQKTLMLFRHICQEIINEWDEQERCAQIKAEQENSLYRYKNKNHGTGLSEEEEEEREFRQQFPLHEKDFADIIAQPTLEEKMETEDEPAKGTDKDVILISQNSMQAVMLVHQQLCLNFARSLWYQQDLPSHQPKHYFSLFLACYQTGASLVTHFYPWMGSEVNDKLLGSQLLGSTLFYNTLFDETTSDLALKPDEPYDFYQHPNIKEVRQCQPVLRDFTEEINRLLQDWPEHPALMQLMVVMDRIRSFPLSSPLSKFLNGLEILLAKSQDWEENASRTLSLRKHLDLVSHLIIQWRKLELNCWSTSLDNTMKRHMEKSTKHWFSIYQMLEKHMQEQTEGKEECDRQMALTMLVSTLQAFIEGASLGEFHVRLQMLLVFHCHVLLMPQVEGKDSLCSVLWNLYHYYKQFSGRVQARIEELRSPLEKELKEFVKISKWNDVSFWAIKQSVEKTHRTLFKFMKKFEVVLSEPCRPSLVESTQEEQLDCLQKQPVADGEKTPIQNLNSILVQTLLARSGSTQTLLPESFRDITPFPLEGLLQGRLPKLTKRMKNICIKIMKQSSLPDLVENLDHFTGDIISSVCELQSLAVDPNTDKEKQKSEVKHILLQKQRALSELFKDLIKIGLSYRKGLAWARSNDLQNILHLHPLDLHSALSIVGNTQGSDARLLAEISSSWDGCQKYFYRSLARHLRLQAAFLAPSKEIGMSIIDRCKGFSAHLMKTLIHQRSSLTALTEQWIILRNLLSCVQEIHSRLPGSHLVAFPPQDGVQQWTEKLQHLSMQSMIVLEQLSWFLQCCPKEQSLSSMDDKSGADGLSTSHSGKSSSEITEPILGEASGAMPNMIALELNYPSPVFGDYLPPGCRMRKSDQLWYSSVMKVSEMLTTMKTVKAEVDKIRQQACETLFHSWKHFEVCSSGLNYMSKVSAQLQDLESLFILPGTEAKQTEQQITLVKSLEYIRKEINTAMADFIAWKTHLLTSSKQEDNHISDEGFVEDFSAQMEIAIQAILFATQNLAERSNQKVQDGKEQATQQEESETEASVERLQSGLLTKLLEDDFWTDVNSLHVQKIISTISELLERLKSYGEDCIAEKHKFFNQACSLLVRLMPLLSRYSDLVLFHLTVSLATHRSTGKLLSVLTHVFSELGQKGFCLPKELMEESAGEGASEFHDYEGGGIGEGEGLKDVSDQIENEEQVEDSHQKGQEKEKEDPDSQSDIKGEDNAIEMSEDFDGKMHDGELEKREEDDEKSNNENEELDKQMGDLNGEQAEKLDERLWGDDEEEEEEDEDDSKTEETGPGMDEEDSELVAKDDNMDASNQNKDQKQRNKQEEEGEGKADDDGQGKEKIHEQIDEREYDENEVDPYYDNQEKQLEPEPLDLPDDLNLDGAEKSDEEDKDEEEGEANPLEIDEKPVDPEETGCGTEGKDQEAIPDQSKEGQDEGLPEEGTSEDKMEEEKEAEAGLDNQEKDSIENSEENAAEEEEENKDASKEASEENRVPTHQGLQPQEEEREIPEGDEEVPEGTERKEHESTGQTGEESLQSEIALEQAGSASEKDQAKEEHGSGTADARQVEGHESKLMSRLASQKQSKRNTQSFKRKPGHADNERSMGDHSEHVHKRLRTVESTSSAEQEASKSQANAEEADAFEHIKQGSESYDAQTYDVASQEQQQSAQPPSSEQEENTEDASMEIDEQEDLRTVDTQELKPEEVKSGASATQGNDETDMETQPTKSEEDQDRRPDRSPSKMENEKQERSRESSIHTAPQYLTDSTFQYIEKDVGELRQELERQLETWQKQEPGCPAEEKAAAEMWQQYLVLTAPLSQQLCEQLRLILEPTQAAKLKGDYRTGKRLNMRKVIPYIASQFRKDKIWLRRTKPSKRQYQICLAIDDSSSMIDNHTKQLAYESLAVIGNALALLEVGQIAVYSFGETVQLLHPFHEQFNDQSGTRILQFCKFQQKKTKIAQFLELSASMFTAAQQLSQNISSETAQLLLIVSDGRGLFLEGKDRVTAAVQTARNANIFVIFVILDNPNSRDSILDIKVPVFKGPGELPEIHSYIEEFPFPFYLILRDVNALPETLGDALRQWFELVTASDGP
ncbi:midasin isoform X1 [Monodelphis domestica]|uniref:midasin isoform X1 n=1 Tax=Monodelphis domestica TaxID=13616 RepID=UPI0024E1D39C|nr:midasin isoform X1 [Monodelphis domestica]